MARSCYVSQSVDHPEIKDQKGALSFRTDNEAKAREHAAATSEAGPRFLLVFDDGVLVEETPGTPEVCRSSCLRQEARRLALEAQALAVGA